MASKKFQNISKQKNLSRAENTRNKLNYYLIVCEGKQTEPNYFKALKKQLPRGILNIDVLGTGADTQTIVNIAENKNIESKETSRPYDKVWVVFDRDQFPLDKFDNAIKSAEAKKIGCAWSNKAFELWYLLHFEYCVTKMSCKEYNKSLSNHLKSKYQKNDPNMYEKLKSLQGTAIKNSERLLKMHLGATPSRLNPATTVHLLVKELNKYLKR